MGTCDNDEGGTYNNDETDCECDDAEIREDEDLCSVDCDNDEVCED